MTIAACYVTPEGIVFGSDSTTSSLGNGELQFFNNNQKLYEIGANSTLGLVTWGLGSLDEISYRTLVAQFADILEITPCNSVQEVTNKWIDQFWPIYRNGPIKPFLDQCHELAKKLPFDPEKNNSDCRSREEENDFATLQREFVIGFCIGGYVKNERSPYAFEVLFEPLADKPTPKKIDQYRFRGAPSVIGRIIDGCDPKIIGAILNSGKWSGTPNELGTLLSQYKLGHPILPIRDAIDFVHTCIYSTIKAMKFSSLAKVCGGPIEIAVITTDRNFRWVRHKEWDAAINEGGC